MARNRACLRRGGPTSILLAPLDASEHCPRHRRNSHAVPFHHGPRAPWCAVVGQRLPVRTMPPRRASRPTTTLSNARFRARPGAPTTSLTAIPKPLMTRRADRHHQRLRCGGAPCAPDTRMDKNLRIGSRASRALEGTWEHEHGNATLQQELPAPLQRDE